MHTYPIFIYQEFRKLLLYYRAIPTLSVSPVSVHFVDQFTPASLPLHVLNQQLEGTVGIDICCSTAMRCDEDVGSIPERIVLWKRFGIRHV